jgi:hypothetical protein
MVWPLRFNDGYSRDLVREFKTEEAALKNACALRIKCIDLSIEGPDGVRYDEAAIANWCRKHNL